MNRSAPHVFALTIFSLLASAVPADDHPIVQFDMPLTAAATVLDDPSLVTINLQLSSMIESIETPPISHWMVRCNPRDEAIRVVDYAPRTATGSDLATPIQTKRTNEQSQSAGISIDGTYSNLARAHVGSDRGRKESESLTFDRIAPVQAVIASGTIQRGRGVYFKLRWTATQVLEGEKSFQLTMQVPPGWRGGLIDVSVVAISQSTSLAPWDNTAKQIGGARFVVAAYRAGDIDAERLARSISAAELELRQLSKQPSRSRRPRSFPSMIHSFAAKLELDVDQSSDDWMQRLLLGKADPHLDKQIRRLPMPIRVAVLDYVDLRDEFKSLHKEYGNHVAAKPAL